MKDLAWLRQEVEKLDTEESQRYPHWEAVWKAEVMELIDQVEQPEILSQEWIDDHKVARISNLKKMTTSDVVPAEQLEKLIVAKVKQPEITIDQAWEVITGKYGEETLLNNIEYVKANGYIVSEKPVVPVWFDEWCKDRVWGDKIQRGGHCTRGDLYSLFEVANLEDLHGLTKEQGRHIAVGFFKYLSALQNGYIVEEKKYEVAFNMRTYKVNLIRYKGTNDWGFTNSSEELYSDHLFTEKEIKDFDERYWAFAKEVTE